MTKQKEILTEQIVDILSKYVSVPNGHNPELYRKHFIGDLNLLIDDLCRLHDLSMKLGAKNAFKTLNRRGWSIHNSKNTKMTSSETIKYLYPNNVQV